MITSGIDTYATLIEADAYIASYYTLADIGDYWEALEDNQKETFLRLSLQEIESMPLVGAKYLYTQELQFPRRSNFYLGYDIAEEVKNAQIENALSILEQRLTKKEADGKILHSKKAEQILRRWTSGGFKMGGASYGYSK